MFYNTNLNVLLSTTNDTDIPGTEKVYVDWPEENSEDYRFVSSRMEDIESDFQPLVAAEDIKRGVDVTGNLKELRIRNKPPTQENNNKRYEDLSRKQQIRQKNSSIPPLDLISQHSSIEIPGAKGAIDIDFRSTTDSMSEDYDDQDDNIEVEQDSLDDHHEQYALQDNDIYHTTLPRVLHEDLRINHAEYNSSRYSHDNANSRRFSDITVPSQYRTEVPIEHNYIQYESANQHARENEKSAFESVQQRYRQTISSVALEQTTAAKHDMTSANPSSNLHKSKPTLHVAPQIKQFLNDKSPNFIELNKVTLNQQKQTNQTSYAHQFADRQRKDSPSRSVKRSVPMKDIPSSTHNNTEKIDRNSTLSTEEYWSKRERSVERLTRDHIENREHREHREHRDESLDQIQRPIYPPNHSNVVYTFTQYGEPLIINTGDGNYPTNIPRSQEMIHHQSINQPTPEYYRPVNMISQNNVNALTSPRAQRSNNYIQEMRRSIESDHIFQDAAFKRQPTMYDEKLLDKKTRILSSERIASHLPPLPGSSDSNISQAMGNSYSAHLRKKEVTYEQYTLRDFKNIKQINTVGGLGPNLGTESHKQMREKLIRQKNYSKAVKEKNHELLRNREREGKEQSSPVLKSDDLSHRANEESIQTDTNNRNIDQESSYWVSDQGEQKNEDKSEKATPKSTFSSANSKVREQVAKRDAMINYSKTVKEKQLKKQISKNKLGGSQSEISKKDTDSPKIAHELFNNSDLDRLLQRHEYDKRMTDQIRQKWEKIN